MEFLLGQSLSGIFVLKIAIERLIGNSSHPSIARRIPTVFLTKVFRECFLKYVFQLCLCFDMDPLNDYGFMTDGAFARDH
jgi:hypothetical protein